MIPSSVLLDALYANGFDMFTGVPCSYLTPLIEAAIDSPRVDYIAAANEGDAVAIACGALLGGRRCVVMLQNSGLGNAVNPLTSLAAIFQLPILMLIGWRGDPSGPADEPQHQVMGAITPSLLETMGVEYSVLPENTGEIAGVLAAAVERLESKKVGYALLARRGSLGPYAVNRSPATKPPLSAGEMDAATGEALDPDAVLRSIQTNAAPTTAVLACTGYTSRALWALDDRPNQFYMVGSMGCVSSLALGLAKARPSQPVVAIDGDGALLMRLGALATIAREKPPNLTHIVLDNGCYESTGGQVSVSGNVDFVGVARACGYPTAVGISRLGELEALLKDDAKALRLIHVRTKPFRSDALPRPTISPARVAQRFSQWLREC